MISKMLKLCVGLLVSAAAARYLPQGSPTSIYGQVEHAANEQFERVFGYHPR
jgi:hypothetical protein